MNMRDNEYTATQVAEIIETAQDALALGNDAQERGQAFAGYYAEAMAHLIEALKGQQQEIARLRQQTEATA